MSTGSIERSYCQELSSPSYRHLNYALNVCVAAATYQLSGQRNRQLDFLITFVAAASLYTCFSKQALCPNGSIEERVCCLDNRFGLDMLKFQLTALVIETLSAFIRLYKAPKERGVDSRFTELLEDMGMSTRDRDREFQQIKRLAARVVILSGIILAVHTYS